MLSDSPFIEIKGLSKTFDHSKSALLKNINLTFHPGECVSILGSSGSGKSTLLRLLAGLESPSEGSLFFNSKKALTKSFVFQDATLLPWKNVLENVLIPMELSTALNKNRLISKQYKERALGLLEKLGLFEAKDLFPHQLSGGMKMRCSLARALLIEPDVFFLDEPFAALDEETREDLDQMLYELSQSKKINIFFVTHSISEAVFLADRILLIQSKDKSTEENSILDIPSPLKNFSRNSNFYFEENYLRFLRSLKEKARFKTPQSTQGGLQ